MLGLASITSAMEAGSVEASKCAMRCSAPSSKTRKSSARRPLMDFPSSPRAVQPTSTRLTRARIASGARGFAGFASAAPFDRAGCSSPVSPSRSSSPGSRTRGFGNFARWAVLGGACAGCPPAASAPAQRSKNKLQMARRFTERKYARGGNPAYQSRSKSRRGRSAGWSFAFFSASSNFRLSTSSFIFSACHDSRNLSSRRCACSCKIRAESLMSTSGAALGGASCESTTASCASTISLAWQHGQVTSMGAALCRGGLSALGKSGSRTEFGPRRGLGLGPRNRLRDRRGRARLFRQRLAFDEKLHFSGVQDFALEQRLGDTLESFAVGLQDVARALVSAGNNLPHFAVDLNGRVFGIIAVLRDLAAQENRLFFLAERQRPEGTHAPLANHVAGDFRGALDIVSGARGEVAEENFFRGAPAH